VISVVLPEPLQPEMPMTRMAPYSKRPARARRAFCLD
jgi:hypothetical protein